MKRLIPFAVTTLVFLVSFGAVAHAASAVEPADGSLLDRLRPVLDAFQHGQYLYAGSISLVLVVALARRYSPRYWPALGTWLSTDLGSALATLLLSFGTTFAASAAGGTATWAMIWHALAIAFGAAGGYTVLKHVLIVPYMTKLADKGPAWLHTPMQLILWIFQARTPPDAAA